MSDASTYLRNQLRDWMVNGDSMPTPPANIYVALHTGDPGSDCSLNEVSAGGYARYESTIPGDWNRPTTGSFENANDFLFNQATEDWGSISYFSLWDGPGSTDNALGCDSLTKSVDVFTDDAPIFRTGKLTGDFL